MSGEGAVIDVIRVYGTDEEEDRQEYFVQPMYAHWGRTVHSFSDTVLLEVFGCVYSIIRLGTRISIQPRLSV